MKLGKKELEKYALFVIIVGGVERFHAKNVFNQKEFIQLESLPQRDAASLGVVFGIVGGIGAGKSFTTAEFVAQGAVRFDADQEAKKLYEDPKTILDLKKNWPEAVDSSGCLDRRALAGIVFAPTFKGRRELERLNKMIQPRLLKIFTNWLAQKETEKREFIVLDAPLLFEAHWDSFVDFVVFVEASEETRLRRVLKRGWTLDELKERESCQMDSQTKKERADFVVTAERDDSRMKEQVAQILRKVRCCRNKAFRSINGDKLRNGANASSSFRKVV